MAVVNGNRRITVFIIALDDIYFSFGEPLLYRQFRGRYACYLLFRENCARYAVLSRLTAYFALSWYYTWDVPFAPGQMLGDIGLKTRGWGNVLVENNHIDMFVFGFADVLDWLASQYGEKRFSGFARVIRTSMCQLLPYEGHLCGVALPGFYSEVVQHTQWDYGKNGKGYYNDLFVSGRRRIFGVRRRCWKNSLSGELL